MENTGNTMTDRNAILAKALSDKDFLCNRDMRDNPARLFEGVERRLAHKTPLADLLGRPPQSDMALCCEETLRQRRLIDDTAEPLVNPYTLWKLRNTAAKNRQDSVPQQPAAPNSDGQLTIPFGQDFCLRLCA